MDFGLLRLELFGKTAVSYERQGTFFSNSVEYCVGQLYKAFLKFTPGLLLSTAN